MAHRNVELLAVGAGPANLAPAVAVEELAPELAGDTLLIEREQDIVWQRGMLLPDALSQVSFLKDLVTMRNPCSRFSFVNFLHSQERLDAFVNLASFVPYRSEISEYLQWVAGELAAVKVEYGRECTSVEAVNGEGGELSGRLVTLANGDTIGCRYLVIGAGRDAHVPAVFDGLPAERHVVSSAAKAGLTPEELALRPAGQIRATLEAAGISVDGFAPFDKGYRQTVIDFVTDLHNDGAFRLKTVRLPYVEATGEYLMEGLVAGDCPVCPVESRGGLCESCGHPNNYEHWLSEHGIDLVYFLGFDNVYFWGMTHLALLMAHGDRYVEPHAIVSNEFYELENQKFSTSKGHVVWAADLVAEVPRDLVRFYLALTAPEHSRTNFSREALDTLASDRLVEPWNRLAGRVEELLAAVPADALLPVSRTGADHAGILVERFRSHYELESFSLHRAADLVVVHLDRLLKQTDRVAVGSATDLGDLVLAVRTLLACAAPLLVDLAARAERAGADLTLPAGPSAATPVAPALGTKGGAWLIPPVAGTALKLTSATACRVVDEITDHTTDPYWQRRLEKEFGDPLPGFNPAWVTAAKDAYYSSFSETGGPLVVDLGGDAYAYAACGGPSFKFAPLIARSLADRLTGRVPSPIGLGALDALAPQLAGR
ncbi:SidA/IucD/PvdA family monooxygenase [Streptomyces sp. NPDC040724]|uniref:SidA/IucD/PvdA family monooxygenase n=1 Tax=Streptomyces sp. NPDC040724 TaxID=3155612 RepID=UPI0033E0E856